MIPLPPNKLSCGQGPSSCSVSQLLGPSTNTQHPLRLHLIIFILHYNSTDMDSWVEYSGSRQSRTALSPPTSALLSFKFQSFTVWAFYSHLWLKIAADWLAVKGDILCWAVMQNTTLKIFDVVERNYFYFILRLWWNRNMGNTEKQIISAESSQTTENYFATFLSQTATNLSLIKQCCPNHPQSW